MTGYNTHNVEKSQSDLVASAHNLYARFNWIYYNYNTREV